MDNIAFYEIDEWQFDYKTRNSASEFVSFLRDDNKSVALFEMLHSDNTESDKQESVRNESWLKTKWENDPTVVSCLNFLCMLSGKGTESITAQSGAVASGIMRIRIICSICRE